MWLHFGRIFEVLVSCEELLFLALFIVTLTTINQDVSKMMLFYVSGIAPTKAML